MHMVFGVCDSSTRPGGEFLWERRIAFQLKRRRLECRISDSGESSEGQYYDPQDGRGAYEMYERIADSPDHVNRYVRIYYIQCCGQVYPEADHMNR